MFWHNQDEKLGLEATVIAVSRSPSRSPFAFLSLRAEGVAISSWAEEISEGEA